MKFMEKTVPQSGSNDRAPKPLVSVIIPAYNVERYIAQTVDSVLAQTYRPIEIVITDDGSTDGTRAVLEPYIARGDVRYFFQKNKGPHVARNASIRASKGKYIALLDADDLFLSEKIEKQVAYLEAHPKCDACYCNLWHFYEEEPNKLLALDTELGYTFYSGKDVLPHLMKTQFINPLSVEFRRSVFDRFGFFDESYWYSEDEEFWIRVAFGGGRFDFLPERLAKYRMRKTSRSRGLQVLIDSEKAELRIFVNLRKKMSVAQRKEFRIGKIIFYHKAKIVYLELVNRFSFMKRIHPWLRKIFKLIKKGP